MVRWPPVPKVGLDHDYTQVSLSHSERKLHGGLRMGANQGMTRPVTGIHSPRPSATGNGLLNFPSSSTWHINNFCCLFGFIFHSQ